MKKNRNATLLKPSNHNPPKAPKIAAELCATVAPDKDVAIEIVPLKSDATYSDTTATDTDGSAPLPVLPPRPYCVVSDALDALLDNCKPQLHCTYFEEVEDATQ